MANALITAIMIIGVPAEPMKPNVAELVKNLGTDQVWVEIRKRAISETPAVKAAWALRQLGKQAVPALADALDADPTPTRRANAALILGWIDDPSTLEPLRKAALKESDEPARALAIEALARKRDPESLDVFLSLVRSAKPNVRISALGGLISYFPASDRQQHVLDHQNQRRASAAVVAALDDSDGGVRFAAVSGATQVGDTNAVPGLIRALEDEQPYVPGTAATALGELRHRTAVVALIRAAQRKPDEHYRRLFAVRSLGKLGDVRAVAPLIEMLDERDALLRRDVATALGQLGDRRAVKPLIDLLSVEDADVANAAALSLGELGDVRAVKPLLAELKRRTESEKDLYFEPIAAALGKLNDPRAIKPLATALFSEKERRRADPETTAKAIGAIQHPDAVQVLVEGLLAGSSNHWAKVHARRVVDRLSGRRFGNDMELRQWWMENKRWYAIK